MTHYDCFSVYIINTRKPACSFNKLNYINYLQKKGLYEKVYIFCTNNHRNCSKCSR